MKSYSTLYKTIDTHPNSFFIGANSPKGFSYADTPFLREQEINKLYVIKGGPGTGKSTIMKKCRDHFEHMGAIVTSFYCSSDPSSLDALLIDKNEKRVAIADGTPPHNLDGELPGACSEIVNLGKYWNSSLLEKERDKIATITANKKLAFITSEKYIRAASEASQLLRDTAKNGFIEQKAEKAAKKLCLSLPKPHGTQSSMRLYTCALSMKGAFRLSTLENAKHLIAIEDFCHISPIFMDLLADALCARGHSVIIGLTPLGDIKEILLPQINTAIVPARDGLTYERTIRLRRFADKDYFSQNTAKRRFNERYLYRMCEAALTALSEADKYHFELEAIYTSAMDFASVEQRSQRLISTISSVLK